eukprot:gene17291-35690_t
MSIVEVKVPDIGDFKEVEIIELMIKVGDTIKVDQSLITVESDKASMEIPSSAAGVVKEIKVKVGDKVAEGSLLLLLAGFALRQRGRTVAHERARRESAERSLRRSEELLDRTFQRNPEPMLVVDHHSGLVQDANPAVAALLGLTEAQVVGQPLRSLAHHIGMDTLKRLARAIDLDGLLDALPVSVTRADGQQRACLVSADKLRVARQQLYALHPDFCSVTYGAGGSTQEGTFATVGAILGEGVPAASHFSCIGATKASVREELATLKAMGVKRLVALRGDLPSGYGAGGEFHYASDLVAFIRAETGDDFHIEVAAYPEIHPQAKSPESDLQAFATKVKAG